MNKLDSLYNSGMKPLVYSDHNAKNKSKSILIQKWVGIEQEVTYVIIMDH